jgi:hypothetical protein
MIGMNTALAILCVGSVAFMLWFLVAPVKESAAAWPRPLKTYVAKHKPSRRTGNVVVMNPKARDRKRAVGGK